MTKDTEPTQPTAADFVEQASDIVAAYVSHNSVPVSELPGLLAGVHAALASLSAPSATVIEPTVKPTPAEIRKSVRPDALISFEDGKPYKTLRRHLTLRGLSPEAYREKWGLPRDYPMTAASYSAQRSELARSLGLGQQRRKASSTVQVQAEEKKTSTKRKRLVNASGLDGDPVVKP